MTQASIAAEPTLDLKLSPEVANAWLRTYATTAPVSPSAKTEKSHSAMPNRSWADAQAAWQRWHRTSSENYFNNSQWHWYTVLERARVETLASRDLPGIAFNLAGFEALIPSNTPLANLYVTARTAFGGNAKFGLPIEQPSNPPTRPIRFWHQWLKRQPIKATPPTQTQILEALEQAKRFLDDGLRFAQCILPLVTAMDKHYGSFDLSEENLLGKSFQKTDVLPQQVDPSSDTEIYSPEATKSQSNQTGQNAEQAYPGYKVWSRQWDEVGPAAQWLRPNDQEALKLIHALDHSKAIQLARRLQRQLLAARLRHWAFEQEEGRLDSRRLARLLSSASAQRVFRLEAETMTPEACVTLLVDQSGSMRGLRQRITVQAVDLAVDTLQACQISCEVLGYTTRFSGHSPLADDWRRAGSPAQAGRLNAVRHIIYKAPTQSWQRTRNQLALMLRDDFGSENIDGEALHWAASRLMRQRQQRKILIVLSDGTPYDPSTTQANGRIYLENHLREVIEEIDRSPIHLVAMGAGHDVGRFYRHALTLNQPEAVAEILFTQLARLLTQPASHKKAAP